MHNLTTPAYRKYLKDRRAWEQSLSQDTYTIVEASEVMKLSKNTVGRLVKEGKLSAGTHGKRGTIIPKKAIVNYMVPERSWLSFFT